MKTFGIRLLVLSCCGALATARADVVINEIHYHPDSNAEHVEFIELYNTATTAVDVSGWRFVSGVSYVFPVGTVISGEGYLVTSEDPAAVLAKFAVATLGPWSGRLNNDGETIMLCDANTQTIDEVTYKPGFPWPADANGGGSSMELLNPSLDNDLGGSWRSSRPFEFMRGVVGEAEDVVYVAPQSLQWHYRPGTAEASDPTDAWRYAQFAEDANWLACRTSIGYGDDGDNTVLSNMPNTYLTVYLRHVFVITNASQIMDTLRLHVYVDDGCIAWLNGTSVARLYVSPGEKAYNDVTGQSNHECYPSSWDDVSISNASSLLVVGTNVLAIHALNVSYASSDFHLDATLTGQHTAMGTASPGRRNNRWTANAPPQIRQVAHTPQQPLAGQPLVVTAEITDPDGVGAVTLQYQPVAPGAYIPAWVPLTISQLSSAPATPLLINPAFTNDAKWISVPMTDDGTGSDAVAGDDIFTAVLPGQANRTLVRYRITAADGAANSVTVPYADDDSLNFACFIYNGVPAYTAATRSVSGTVPYVYGTNITRMLPTYHLLTRTQDVVDCLAYDSGRQVYGESQQVYNWEGSLVYDGEVYDHMRYRLRGHNGRYGLAGKRSMRFKFNRNREFQALDMFGAPYPATWRHMNVSKTFDNFGVGNFGVLETIDGMMYRLAGSHAPRTHWFQLRVVDGAAEAPTSANGQYYGDFWGLFLALEDYDGAFLNTHGLPDGNLYKLTDGQSIIDNQRHQGRDSVIDGSDMNTYQSQLTYTRTRAELERMVNYTNFYKYYATSLMIRSIDYWAWCGKNMALLFEPWSNSPCGRVWYFPYDYDCSWGPTWNWGESEAFAAINNNNPRALFAMDATGQSAMKTDLRNTIRELRDLLWLPGVINPMLDELASVIKPFVPADRDRWCSAPADAGSMDFGTLEAKIADMKTFAWVGGSGWPNGNGIPEFNSIGSGGWMKAISDLSDSCGDLTSIPATPTITCVGPTGYPSDSLTFQCSAFSDPQGNGTFSAMKWRLAEISRTNMSGYSFATRKYEINAVWEQEQASYASAVSVPGWIASSGRVYRARVKMRDTTGRWSHWSAPVEFVAGASASAGVEARWLRVSEVMYDPPAGSDFEFVELVNTSTDTVVNLSDVTFTNGIYYTIPPGTNLAPGAYALVTRHPDIAAFTAYYKVPPGTIVLGPYSGKLNNGGEEVELRSSDGQTILASFTYNNGRGWPAAAAGAGHSLVPADIAMDQAHGALDYGRHWRASALVNGSPGAADSAPPWPLVINEFMALDAVPWIELFNTSDAPVPLDGWFLSTNATALTIWPLASLGTVPAHGCTVCDVPGLGGSINGGTLYLSHVTGTSNDCVAYAVKFKAQDISHSCGKLPDGAEFDYALSPTRDSGNSNGCLPVIISELMYHPPGTATGEALKYIEISNPGPTNVSLWTTYGAWRINGEVEFYFSDNTEIAPSASVVVVSFAPTNQTLMNAFLSAYVPSGMMVAVLGPYTGTLSEHGARIALECPVFPNGEWSIVDELIYFDQVPFPPSADGTGEALLRLHEDTAGDDPASWIAAAPHPGTPVLPEPVLTAALVIACVWRRGWTRLKWWHRTRS